MQIGSFLSNLLRIGFTLAMLGLLGQVLASTLREAAHSTQHGQISLRALNRQIMSKPAHEPRNDRSAKNR